MIAYCLKCSNRFNYRKSQQHGKYCSNECQIEYQFLTKYYNWLHNKQQPKRISYRKAVIHRDGYKCSECKISEWNDKPIVLELEHKDGNSGNNLSNNLCLICPNCHSQTSTYKAKNKGKGRHFRRTRYAAGKSF